MTLLLMFTKFSFIHQKNKFMKSKKYLLTLQVYILTYQRMINVFRPFSICEMHIRNLNL